MIRFLTIIFILLGTLSANAGTYVYNANDSADCINLIPYCEILEDADHAYTITDIIQNPNVLTDQYQTYDVPTINFDFSTKGYWIKFRIQNNSDRDRELLLECARAVTNIVDLYEVKNNTVVHSEHSGDGIPFNERDFKFHKSVFQVHLHANETKSYVIYVESDGEVLLLPMKLYTTEAFLEAANSEQYFNGIYYGLLLFSCIIFFFFYVFLRNPSFLRYVFYIISLTFMQLSLDGYAFHYLWPSNTWFANHAVLIFANLTLIFVIKYVQMFLETGVKSAFCHKMLNLFLYAGVISLIMSLFSGPVYHMAFYVANIVSLLGILATLASIIVYRAQKIEVCLYFTAAFLSIILGAILFILDNFNVMPPNPITPNAVKFGSGLEVILLSIAMANRYRTAQREKAIAQKEALDQLEEKNALKDKINQRLETEVAERTAEIVLQKEELAEKNKDITDSINYAQRIQSAILPTQTIIKKLLPNSFVLFNPKDIVSGDFYWLEAKNGRVYFAACDCTGHGVPGAMVSVVGHNTLNRVLREFNETQPGAILDQLTKLVESTFANEDQSLRDGMDMALCSFDPSQPQSIQYAGANNPLYLVRAKDEEAPLGLSPNQETDTHCLYEIKADKQPIGNYENRKPFTTVDLPLAPGDRIYVFSDGYPDQFGGPKGKKYKYKRFKQLLLQLQSLNMSEQQTALHEEMTTWSAGHEQVDDICIIGVEMAG